MRDIGEHAILERLAEHRFEPRAIVLGIAAQRFGNGVERRAARERRAVLRGRRGVVVVVVAPQRLERRELPAETRIEAPQQLGQRIEIRQRREHRLLAARARDQAQFGARDDAERALAADEQLLEVVAGVVLEHAIERGEHRAVGEHGFDAEHEVAHHSVAQDAQAAGVGRDVAADGGAVARAEVERETPCRASSAARCTWPSLRSRLRTQRAPGHVDALDAHSWIRATGRCRRASASAPFTRPVSPPCVTTGWPRAWHNLSTAETCSVVRGRTSSSASTRPCHRRAGALTHRGAFEHPLLADDGAQIRFEVGLWTCGRKVTRHARQPPCAAAVLRHQCKRRLLLLFLVVDRKQRLIERVNVGRDVHGAGDEHAATEQQIGHGAHAETAQALFAAGEHGVAFARLAETPAAFSRRARPRRRSARAR